MSTFCPNGHENPATHRFCQACGSQIVAPVNSSMAEGVLLGDRYQIVKEIGQGGFGRTYLCEDTNRFNEPCVLKEFAPQVQGTALLTKAQQLFEREAGVMYRLQHLQIPKFREMFRVNRSNIGQLFLVQDYVPGENYQQLLRAKLKRHQSFTEAEIIEFLTQILPVLGYIHSLGVIHRDISPDNLIKRASDGLPVLIDFGGVKQVAVNAATQYMSGAGSSDVSTRLGKVGYAPNEQMQRGCVFPHSDLYALAATTLVLLTGKEPPDLIDAQNFTWNWREHISLSPNLASILDRMLQLRPNDRFASAQDVLTALNPTVPDTRVLSVPSTHTSSPSKPSTVSTPTVVVKQKPKQLAANIVTEPVITPATIQANSRPEASLLQVLGKTWMAIAAVAGAIGVGWAVASLVPKQPQPVTPTSDSSTGNANGSIVNSNGSTPTPAISNSTDGTMMAAIEPTFPTSLVGKGVNTQAYGSAVKQIFTSQNPQVTTVDSKVRTQIDTIASDLGTKLSQQLSSEAISKIGQYSDSDRASWKAQVNKLHLSERSLINLTDAKYRLITDSSAEKLGLEQTRFLKTPIGQVYLATMFDRFQAIQSKQAIGEIVFPVGGDKGTISGTLQPGEGKAFIASLFGGQDITVNIKTNNLPTKLSIYPPTSNLPAILSASPKTSWSGKTSVNGYHELILVSNSDQPIQYELQLTAADLPPARTGGTSPSTRRSKSSSPSSTPDKQPLW
jgi:serine/threonine protein kinase, bacterial